MLPDISQIDALVRDWIYNNLGLTLEALQLFPNIP